MVGENHIAFLSVLFQFAIAQSTTVQVKDKGEK